MNRQHSEGCVVGCYYCAKHICCSLCVCVLFCIEFTLLILISNCFNVLTPLQLFRLDLSKSMDPKLWPFASLPKINFNKTSSRVCLCAKFVCKNMITKKRLIQASNFIQISFFFHVLTVISAKRLK